LEAVTEPIAYKVEPGGSWYYYGWCGGLFDGLQRYRDCSLFIHYLWFLWISWHTVWSWLGVSGPDPLNVSEHFYQFTHSAGGLRARCSFLQLVWLLCAWIIWNDLNQRLFNNIGSFIDQLLDKVKHYSFWWLKARNVIFVYGFTSWWSNPMVCLRID